MTMELGTIPGCPRSASAGELFARALEGLDTLRGAIRAAVGVSAGSAG